MAEAGYPSVELVVWHGIVAPLGTPPALVKKLNEEFVKAAQRPMWCRRPPRKAWR